jgi:hypothetical protein
MQSTGPLFADITNVSVALKLCLDSAGQPETETDVKLDPQRRPIPTSGLTLAKFKVFCGASRVRLVYFSA